MKLSKAIAWAVLCLAAVMASAPARAADVDTALVLAVDISSSVNEERYRLQMLGYAEAFRDPAVVASIGQGPNGAIAVTLVQWSDYGEYRQTIGWTVVHDAGTAHRFASAIAETGRPPGGSTSISGAIDASAQLLRESGYRAPWVIDISADGLNNNGRPVADARDAAVAAGITINGLPILSEHPHLDTYFRDQVIGGPGAFAMVAESFQSFSRAIRQKLIVEIARADPAEPASGDGP